MPMTVEDLRRALLGYPDDAPVILALIEYDYAPLGSTCERAWVADGPWTGDIWIPGETDPPVPPEAVPCILLKPC